MPHFPTCTRRLLLDYEQNRESTQTNSISRCLHILYRSYFPCLVSEENGNAVRLRMERVLRESLRANSVTTQFRFGAPKPWPSGSQREGESCRFCQRGALRSAPSVIRDTEVIMRDVTLATGEEPRSPLAARSRSNSEESTNQRHSGAFPLTPRQSLATTWYCIEDTGRGRNDDACSCLFDFFRSRVNLFLSVRREAKPPCPPSPATHTAPLFKRCHECEPVRQWT